MRKLGVSHRSGEPEVDFSWPVDAFARQRWGGEGQQEFLIGARPAGVRASVGTTGTTRSDAGISVAAGLDHLNCQPSLLRENRSPPGVDYLVFTKRSSLLHSASQALNGFKSLRLA
jgi:hypothetical protein